MAGNSKDSKILAYKDMINQLNKTIAAQTERKGQILRSTSNTAPLTCGACNTQPEGLLTMA